MDNRQVREFVSDCVTVGMVIEPETPQIWADHLSVPVQQVEDAIMHVLSFLYQRHRERHNLLQKWQATIPDPYRQEVCDILANGMSYRWEQRVTPQDLGADDD